MALIPVKYTKPSKDGGKGVGGAIGSVVGGAIGAVVGTVTHGNPVGGWAAGTTAGGAVGGAIGGAVAPSKAGSVTQANVMQRRVEKQPQTESQILEQSLMALKEMPELQESYKAPLLSAYEKAIKKNGLV